MKAYLRQLDQHPMLDAEREQALARTIEQLELARWRALLARPGAAAFTAAAVAPLLRPRAGGLPALDELASCERAGAGQFGTLIAAAARELRAADAGHAGFRAAETAIWSAFSNEPEAQGYLAELTRARAAHERAKHTFVEANLRLVIAMAQRYKQRGLSLTDLIQEGNIGLMRAVERFDYRRGLRFSTYAGFWIRHSINRALSDKSRLVRVPVRMFEAVLRSEQVAAASTARGRSPGSGPAAARPAGLSARALARAQALAAGKEPLSLDGKSGKRGEYALHDVLASEQAESPELRCEVVEGLQALEQSFGVLSPFEGEVLRLHFGLVDGTEVTLSDIGERHGLSRERIRQVKDAALRKLRDRIETGARALDAREAA